MAKRRKKPGKTFQQRQTERKLREQERELELDSIVEDMASRYSCSTESAREFADQCSDRIDDIAYDLDCAKVALDFWTEGPPHLQPLAAALRELVAEHQRHAVVLADLRQRLTAITTSSNMHHHLERSVKHYQDQLRLRLFPDPTPEPVQNYAVSNEH